MDITTFTLAKKYAKETAERVEQLAEEVGGKITASTTAQVGQTIRVKAVDEAGKPTEWECVDFPSAQSAKMELLADITLSEDATRVVLVDDITPYEHVVVLIKWTLVPSGQWRILYRGYACGWYNRPTQSQNDMDMNEIVYSNSAKFGYTKQIWYTTGEYLWTNNKKVSNKHILDLSSNNDKTLHVDWWTENGLKAGTRFIVLGGIT